jgi:hypothetical protein
MRRKMILLFVLLAMALSATLVAANPQAGFEIPFWTTSSGGASQGGVYTLSGAIGQPGAGSSSGGSYTLVGGFWSILQQAMRLYLPLVVR